MTPTARALLVSMLASTSLAAHAVSNTSSPADWRLAPGASFMGVAGAFDGVARLTSPVPGVPGATSVCSGTLLAGGLYVLTAAHCADSQVDIANMTVSFRLNGADNSQRVDRQVSAVHVHSGWLASGGALGNGSDIALLKLDSAVTGIQGFKLSATNDLGKNFLMAGYGTTTTGSLGAPNWDEWGHAHWGMNTWDTTDKALNDGLNSAFPTWPAGSNAYGETYVADFDSGLAGNNTLGLLATVTGNGWTSGQGLGVLEALIAEGDSGGGDFVWDGDEWLLSGVHSFGWGLCSVCDAVPGTNASYGDLMGSTAVFSHAAWLNSLMSLPEPGTAALAWPAALLALAATARRRRRG